MKKTILILSSIALGALLIYGFISSPKEETMKFLSNKYVILDDDNNGLYHLNIHCKNNAGWFFLTVLNTKDNSNPAAAPSDITGYFPITTETVFPLILPNKGINELTPTFTVFRDNNGHGTPIRGGWSIEFDISCIGKDLVERRITPVYKIQAKNYFDRLIKDANGNDGFKIYLIKDFELKDTTAILNKNTLEYNAFKTRTARQDGNCK